MPSVTIRRVRSVPRMTVREHSAPSTVDVPTANTIPTSGSG